MAQHHAADLLGLKKEKKKKREQIVKDSLEASFSVVLKRDREKKKRLKLQKGIAEAKKTKRLQRLRISQLQHCSTCE